MINKMDEAIRLFNGEMKKKKFKNIQKRMENEHEENEKLDCVGIVLRDVAARVYHAFDSEYDRGRSL